ncbi:TolC family protein [Vulgatibacter incomptus]|uniref:Heavy metal RND efflux outer membrane protein, CzcC family n=1 Tax=Vulgatibacter incomptus TaxID=1391653 RepID=A0A0K1PE68_9BACT|nr:TolC family protein [Vulgatibacter incomptus]AKU91424.1 Heavy metal RND efflux outer membrane protein, CzcC family [Vulgatibacter incomptus]
MLTAFTLIAALAAGAPPASEPAPLVWSEVLNQVLRRNQDLAAYASDREAASERARAAAAYPDPSIGFAIRSLPVPSFSFTQDEMTMKEVLLKQRLPWFGKRDLRREAGDKVAEATGAMADSQRLALAEATADGYAELWLVLSSRAVLEEQTGALERLVALTRARFAAGRQSQADVIRAEAELERLRLPAFELREREVAARAVLAALLSQQEPVGGKPALPDLPDLPSEAALVADLESHPELQVLTRQEEQARLEARLAQREKWPDPEVGLAYGFRTNHPDMVGAEVMIPIPVFAASNQDRLAAAARAEAESASRRRVALRESLASQLRTARAASIREQERLDLYEQELLPRARQTVSAAIGAYQSGGVDFLTLLDAEVQRFGQELEALSSRAGLLRARGRLARASGSLSTLFAMNGGAR